MAEQSPEPSAGPSPTTLAERHDDNCLFCRIVTGAIPATRVYEDDTVIAFRDINPGAPTHVLIIPRTHIAGISAPEAEDGALLVALIRAARQVAAQEGVAESGYRLVWNVGPDAGQSVFHLHLHLLGGRAMAWPPG
ncbi:MAG TPA: histidine triad nucleotide-binding protein [Ktedonobacterales bacterium]|nr:histidine triad nucleotide-binding protein [Ktedonobacterales bacterium]